MVLWAAALSIPKWNTGELEGLVRCIPGYVGARVSVSGATVRLLMPTFPAALLLAPLARSRLGQVLVGLLCALGLVLQVVWVTKFVIPTRGFVP